MIWILQNQDIVPPGRYGALLEKGGNPHRVVRVDKGAILPEPHSGDGVIVLGGTMGVHEIEQYRWMPPLCRYMAEVAAGEIPLLGICLGAQLLASALGGTVSPNRFGERGMQPVHLTSEGVTDHLFDGIPTPFSAQQWHNDSFDLPPGATLLAFSSVCPTQAFRFRNAYAVQFHPEVDETTLFGWNNLLNPPGKYVQEFVTARVRWQSAWDRLLENFLSLCGGNNGRLDTGNKDGINRRRRRPITGRRRRL